MDAVSIHAEKVAAIRRFLDSDPEGVSFHGLLLVGAGASGKSSAFNEAMATSRTALANTADDDEGWNVMVWNCKEVPRYCRFLHAGAPAKWVIIRWEFDALAQSLVDEWPHGESGRVDVLMCHKDPSFGVGV
jgi:hypothetical protein